HALTRDTSATNAWIVHTHHPNGKAGGFRIICFVRVSENTVDGAAESGSDPRVGVEFVNKFGCPTVRSIGGSVNLKGCRWTTEDLTACAGLFINDEHIESGVSGF